MKNTRPPLLRVDRAGLWCEAGGFHIDPWEPVPRALITHARPDQARPYGEPLTIGGVKVSFHPSGYMIGAAQIRIEHEGEVWVVTGDYNPAAPDFELIRCNTFVTEAVYGLPIYRWPDPGKVMRSIEDWWRANQERGRASVLFANPLGKARRILASIDSSIGPIHSHDSIERNDWSRALILAPPSAHGTAHSKEWMKRFAPFSTALASGRMRVRGIRRHRSIDRGFVLSDHADWPGLLDTIAATGAERILVTHGYRGPLVRWLQEQGREAEALETHWGEAE